ncbi:syntaxin-6-like [Macrosteles quadrilineatus]|uniref:syntaxin-6-like n=1 Tax=Macrosteles quadrilineatus TaxID=74068 RepID=UPI0023E2D44B|nr:syntaxin-6-like [Macrosteles quadrilineatus]XP_054289468.1 syntaxin-6-like [Macrosteles quadrilineatus]
MTFEDPFFVVKEEVSKALNKTRGLYRRWLELQEDIVSNITKEELEWTTTELRNALRSIEWDLEDLEDTIGIVEKNPTKFKIDNKELTSRKNFIEQTREEVRCMKEKMNFTRGRDRDRTARQPLLENSPVRVATSHGTTKYSKLENEADSPQRHFLDSTLAQQNQLINGQDDTMERISHTIGSLKTVSRQIGSELDEQAVMLDDFGTEMENTESKLDSTMKKVAKVLHMSNDRRQWIAIAVLSCILLVVVMLLIIL